MGEPSANLASTSPAGPDGVEQRLGRLDWPSLEGQLGARGYARTAPVLTAAECTGVASLYDDDGRFRTRIDMARYNFGRGEYSYFDYPLPPLVATLRTCLYRHLAPLAGRMMAALGATERYPPDHEAYLRHCQARPTPLVLRYRAGDYNNLHRDLYGDVLFPLQATIMLSRRGDDYTGGEFLLVENRARQQSRGSAIPAEQGEMLIFPVHTRPVEGKRGMLKATMRHGVSPIESGERFALGIIFHDSA